MKTSLLKRLLSVALCFICASQICSATNVTRNITLMVGASITLTPYQDSGCPSKAFFSMSNTTYYYNNEISVEPTLFTVNGKNCYTYTLTAMKRGVYKMEVDLKGFYTHSNGGQDNYSVLYTYNITVVDVTKINMPSALNLLPGDIYTISTQILETGATSDLTWTSSNTGVAVVNSSGAVRCLRVGTTDITCTAYNGVSATCKVTVVPIIAESFTFDVKEIELESSETISLNPVFTPANTTDQTVEYKSSNVRVATVDDEGNVTGVNPGSCTITGRTNDGSSLSASCKVTVKNSTIKATSISLNQNTLTFTKAKETATLTATVLPSDVTDGSVTWASSNTTVATVSSTGVVTAIANGTATITATTNDGTQRTANCTVSINIAKKGDVNGDGSVDIGDIVMVISVMTGSETRADIVRVADVNLDGASDIGDIVAIINLMTSQTII